MWSCLSLVVRLLSNVPLTDFQLVLSNDPFCVNLRLSLLPIRLIVDKPLRVLVNGVLPEDKGVTVRGRVVQGVATVGDKLTVSPHGCSATIYRLETGQNAVAGDTCLIGLTNVDAVKTGNILSHANWRPPLVKRVRALLHVLDGVILKGTQAVWHMHSMDLPIYVAKLLPAATSTASSASDGTSLGASKDGKKKVKRVKAIKAGTNAHVEIALSERVCLERYQDCRAMGQFVLRRGGDTIAVGRVEDLLA